MQQFSNLLRRIPSPFKKNFSRCLPAFCVALLAGCTVAEMSIPQPVRSNMEVLPVQGREGIFLAKQISFSPYRLTQIRRGWVSTFTLGVWFWSTSGSGQKYSFFLDSPNQPSPIPVLCATKAKWSELNFEGRSWSLDWGLSGNTATVGSFKMAGRDWAVVVRGDNASALSLAGVITDGNRKIEIQATRDLQGAAWPVLDDVGYFFSENGKVIGAVETINAGKVFFVRGLDAQTKDLLATASGVLLLYQNVLKLQSDI